MPVYAIGDIHGQHDMLRWAHDRIEADRAKYADVDDVTVHLGDLVDRGPESNKVLETLIAGESEGRPWTVLLGNHDRMFSMFMEDPTKPDPNLRVDLDWLDHRLGGTQTLASYGISRGRFQSLASYHRKAIAAVPAGHIEYIRNLPLSHRSGDILFVHAGIRPGIPLDDQSESDLVWIREPFLTDESDHGALIVHGHTVVDEPTHYGNRVALDTGAGYGRPLTVAVFEEGKVWVLTDNGRVPLTPV